MALVNDYFEKTNYYQKEYGEKTIVLMQVGSFYEVYGKKSNGTIIGSQIEAFALYGDLNIVEKNVSIGQYKIVMAGFKDFLIEKYVKKYIEQGYTIIEIVQDNAEKNTTRSVKHIYSSGSYFSTQSTQISNNTICLWLQHIHPNIYIGISCIDIFTGKSFIFEFHEKYYSSPSTFDELERYISIYQPSETILIHNFTEKELQNIILYIGLQSSIIHTISLKEEKDTLNYKKAIHCEKQIYQKEIFTKYFFIQDFSVFIEPYTHFIFATQSFCFLLDFLFIHNPHLVYKIQEPLFENKHKRLLLANHSLRQLNILEDSHMTGKYSCMLSLLNNCKTNMGKRKFSYLLLNPKNDIVLLNKEYEMIDVLLKEYEKEYFSKVFLILSKIKDYEKINRQIMLKKISPKTFYILYHNNLHLLELLETIEHNTILMKYLSFIINVEELKSMIQKINHFISSHILLEIAKDINTCSSFDVNFILSGVDDLLDKEINIIDESMDKLKSCQQYFQQLIQPYDKNKKEVEMIKIHETEKNNFSLVLTNRRSTILKDLLKSKPVTLSYQQKEFTLHFDQYNIEFHKQTSTNSSISHYQINELCKNIHFYKNKIKDNIQRVYHTFIQSFEGFQLDMENISKWIIEIDLLWCNVYNAFTFHLTKPIIEEKPHSFLCIEGVRHLLIEHFQTEELYVSNDIDLGTEQQKGILLYGTNAVGKTSFIKSIGIAVLMAQSGMFVPCSKMLYHPYQSIFTRIIGNDNLFKGLSTFAVEMSELRTILRLADQHSLILGDELCSGTESVSATSIFLAGIQSLYNKNSSFIFATHYHEIIHLEEITSLTHLSLYHMEVIYDQEKDILVYNRKLKKGGGTNMYGLEVCKSLSMPKEFLELANNIRLKYHPESNSILLQNTSKYNSHKIKGLCELCSKEISEEVHHLEYQQDSNKHGIIKKKDSIFHKNHLANLINICKNCHNKIHQDNTKIRKKKGNVLQIL